MADEIVGVKFDAEDKALLRQVCKARGEDFSTFVRRAVRRELASLSYYTPEIKKALGVPVPPTPAVEGST